MMHIHDVGALWRNVAVHMMFGMSGMLLCGVGHGCSVRTTMTSNDEQPCLAFHASKSSVQSSEQHRTRLASVVW